MSQIPTNRNGSEWQGAQTENVRFCHKADIAIPRSDVRFEGKADITLTCRHVRF